MVADDLQPIIVGSDPRSTGVWQGNRYASEIPAMPKRRDLTECPAPSHAKGEGHAGSDLASGLAIDARAA